MKDIVLAMNLQVNYFGHRGTAFLGEHCIPVRENIKKYLHSIPFEMYEIYYTRDVRSPEDAYFNHVKTQCVVGTLDVHIIEGLPRALALMITATRPSALWKTPLLSELSKHKPEKIIIVGAETNVSVLFTAAELRARGYRVEVPEQLVVARDPYLHNAAITIMADTLGVEVT